MTEPNIAVKFGKSNSAKIRVIQAAIDDPTTYLKVLEGSSGREWGPDVLQG